MSQPTTKERGMLFSGEMVRAILAGTKTQTRRIMRQYKSHPHLMPPGKLGYPDRVAEMKMVNGKACWYRADLLDSTGGLVEVESDCPYGNIGNKLWVRETFLVDYEHGENTRGAIPPMVYYRATDTETPWTAPKWKPSIFMPRWASRITLEITDIRVERLQDISEEDAKVEGIWKYGEEDCYKIYTPTTSFGTSNPRDSFASLWRSINGPESWATNPFVWALTFKVVSP